MRDILILGFIMFMIGAAMGRPFLMSMAYIYVDLVSPQRITYYLLNAVPFSLIMAVLAVLFFLMFDDKKDMKFGRLQVLMLIWMAWITITTFSAQLPDYAWVKWSNAWKSIGFGIFLPFVLRTRQRIEVAIYFVVLCVGVLTITGGVKTLAGGGGYGTLNLLVESNSGLYEGSTISAVAVALIPLILYLYRPQYAVHPFETVQAGDFGPYPVGPADPDRHGGPHGADLHRGAGLPAFSEVPQEARYAVDDRHSGRCSVPFLPESFTARMGTIKSHDSDESASTRVAVWNWTLNFAKEHPLGGGFDAYRLNKIEYEVTTTNGGTKRVEDHARAFHSSWFETLGEHGYIGVILYVALQITALLQLRGVERRFKAAGPEDAWIRDLASALFQVILIFMAGSSFVGIAFQTTLYILVALSASLAQLVMARDAVDKKATVAAKPMIRPVLPPRGLARPSR